MNSRIDREGQKEDLHNADCWRLEEFQYCQAVTTTTKHNPPMTGRLDTNTAMPKTKFANENGSIATNTVAVESNLKQSTAQNLSLNLIETIRMYTVPITGEVEMTMKGNVKVYATCKDEAVAKVQCQIDDDSLDDDLEMVSYDTGCTMSHSQIAGGLGTVVEIVEFDVEVDELDEVRLTDVLDAEIEQLQKAISWDAEKQAKLKAFLEALTEAQAAAA